jgi:hypothetical protein
LTSSSQVGRIPRKLRRIKGNNLPTEIRNLIAEKRKARERLHQTRDPQDKRELNNLPQKLKREINEVKNDSISAYLSELANDSNTDYSLWKAIKKINRPVIQIPPFKKSGGKWARNNKKKRNDSLNPGTYIPTTWESDRKRNDNRGQE